MITKIFKVVWLIFFALFFNLRYTYCQLRADEQDSLALLQFQQAVMAEGWPALWATDKNVVEWRGISLDPASGNVTRITILGDQFSPAFETDSLPSSIGILHSLDSLKELTFISLGLKHLPVEIGGFQNLESLGLGNNLLTEVPTNLANLSGLKFLLLNNNRLVDLPSLQALNSLEILSLGSNRTLLEVPSTVFSLTSLTRLDIGFSSVKTLPADINNLVLLKELFVDGTGLESLPPEIGDLQQLEWIRSANNNLTSIPATMGNLQNLRELDVSRNKLTELPGTLNQLTSLVQIRFTSNQLTAFPSSITGLPQLRFIYGERNQMEGEVPAALFNTVGLRLFLEDNNLSGRLEIQANNIPERLFIKNNRFTLGDIIDHFNDFEGFLNNKYLEFQPQQKIGSFRTFYPQEGQDFSVSIDNYTPVTGVEFAWHRQSTITGGQSFKVSDQQDLLLSSFDPATDGGVYYCVVTHPSMSGVSLESERIRVIGVDNPPSLILRDIVFRQGEVPIMIADVEDDYTLVEDLIFTWPSETAHLRFELDPSFPMETRRLVYTKDPAWTGTDTLNLSVTDENGNSTSASAVITVLPMENQPPTVHMPPVVMNIINDIPLPCTPGSPGCNAFYPFVSSTYLKHFVRDDITPSDALDYRILEADPTTGAVSDNVTLVFNTRPDGVTLDATVVAFQDTTVTVTLEVQDEEGGITQQQIQFIGNGVQPNLPPQIASIPPQVIPQGTSNFPLLNLNEYVSDDYLANEGLLWEAFPDASFSVELPDSVAMVTSSFPDSSYSGDIIYRVSEKTNSLRENQQTVSYTIVEGITISGSITNTQGAPLVGVTLIGFPSEVQSDASGNYEARVLQGWSGKVYPVLSNYEFQPDTVNYTNLQVSQAQQDYIGRYVGPVMVSGIVTVGEGGEPLPGVRLEGFPTTTTTDEMGQYTVTLPLGWSGSVYPVLENYVFQPDTVHYTNLQDQQTTQDYVATAVVPKTYTISGKIMNFRTDRPLEGVVMQGFPGAVSTGADGKYEAFVPEGWSGVVTPSRTDFRFAPWQRRYENLQENRDDQDYLGLFVGFYTIAGKISTPGGQPIADVELKGFPEAVFTDQDGEYNVQVPYDWSGTIVPGLDGQLFEPASTSYQDLVEDLVEEHYTTMVLTGVSPAGASVLSIYPNPSDGQVNFSLAGYVYTTGELVISNGLGQVQDRITINPTVVNYTWPLQETGRQGIPQGIYFARLYLDSELKEVRKFAIVK